MLVISNIILLKAVAESTTRVSISEGPSVKPLKNFHSHSQVYIAVACGAAVVFVLVCVTGTVLCIRRKGNGLYY